ncbi:membrane protein [Psychrosphaera saromensis]|uniref:GDYXXLXY domain-containing protein n=1 Tax=Psychrosphaera saromensis TaxID=716813 RepID=A0A2S7UZ51_9GAMM|nr:GDYXXLXY domain-containing protein [Psychrosphaera saromensis]PQJ54561.1 hypothetical protein BTO11_13500 [Psychrosphaera saromensis]GHB58929.1 membrane protein [Psychrosphaera saromensis]GLQ14226.1 membrane protein [Psychrosphaera saromensis]
MRKLVAVITLVLVLGVVNWSIYKKEQLLENGQIVYLPLAPVDPRSLMQGDYMALRFAIVSDIETALEQIQDKDREKDKEDYKGYRTASFDGFVQLSLDENKVGSFVSVTEKINDKEAVVAMKFRQRNGRIKIATNAYFFEEGTGPELESATYGQFRVDTSGDLLLVSLMDKDFNLLGK